MSTRTITKVVKSSAGQEYTYEYEVPVKTGKPGRKTCPNKKLLKETKLTEDEARILLEHLAELRK